MNSSELISKVAEKTGVSKKDAGAVIGATLATIKEALADGERVQIVGFGTFETRHRAERTSKNPRTGEAIKVDATTVPAFKPGKSLKEAVSKK